MNRFSIGVAVLNLSPYGCASSLYVFVYVCVFEKPGSWRRCPISIKCLKVSRQVQRVCECVIDWTTILTFFVIPETLCLTNLTTHHVAGGLWTVCAHVTACACEDLLTVRLFLLQMWKTATSMTTMTTTGTARCDREEEEKRRRRGGAEGKREGGLEREATRNA